MRAAATTLFAFSYVDSRYFATSFGCNREKGLSVERDANGEEKTEDGVGCDDKEDDDDEEDDEEEEKEASASLFSFVFAVIAATEDEVYEAKSCC